MNDDAPPKLTISTSPTIGAIAKALAAGQLAMGPAVKDRVGVIPGKDGKQGYSYGYATLAACFEAIQPLHANGIAVTQIPLDGGNGVLVATILIHESGEWIRGEMWLPVAQQSPQGYGSALTYARRYCLSALCGLASDDDDDGSAASNGPARSSSRGTGSSGSGQRPAPAKAAAVHDLGLFSTMCDRVDAAETSADLNTIAGNAQRAHRDGVLSDSHIEQIKAAVTRKRSVIGGATQTANGGAA